MEETIKSLEEAKLLTQNLPWTKEQIAELEKKFHLIADYFLYGGYINVLNRYRIYIQRIEFYFHSEKDSPNAIKDDIVYHRNDYHVEGSFPYFTPFTFHAHASGFDIAFENPKEEYRASALIRAYEIYDEIEKQYLNYKYAFDIQQKKWIEKGDVFVHSVEPCVNTQSTYLYDILNGFGNAGTISWEHCPLALYAEPEKCNVKIDKRKGVYDKTREKWKNGYDEPRDRKWSFERKESINTII